MRRLALIAAASGAVAIAAPAHEARADDAGIVVAVLVVAVTVVGTDIAFTAYDSGHVIDRKEPATEWMIAQTILMPPQAVLGHVPIVLGQLLPDKGTAKAIGAIFLPVSIWANALSTFSIWSIADQTVDVRPRFGVSWLVGANMTITSGLAASLWSDRHYATPWVSIPAILVGGSEVAGTAFAATKDPVHRGEWIGLAAWSGTMALHGLISLIASGVDSRKGGWSSSSPSTPSSTDDRTYPTPFEPVPLPPPRPHHRLEVPSDAPIPRPPPPGASFLPPMVVPTPLSDGKNVVPGFSLVGRF